MGNLQQPTFLFMRNFTSSVKSNIMQIFTIINLPWKPWNNKIARSESNHKKNTAQQWLQVKKTLQRKTNKTYILSQAT